VVATGLTPTEAEEREAKRGKSIACPKSTLSTIDWLFSLFNTLRYCTQYCLVWYNVSEV